MTLGHTQATSYADKARLVAKPGKNPPAVILIAA